MKIKAEAHATAPTKLAALEKRRDEARAAAAADPRMEEVASLRDQIVVAKMRGMQPDRYRGLVDRRDALRTEIYSVADALSEEIRSARRAAVEAAKAAAAAEAESLADDVIDSKLANIRERRRALKVEQRALTAVQARRQSIQAAKALAAQLSPEQRAALLAEIAKA